MLGQTSFTSSDQDDEAEDMNRPSAVWSDGFSLLVCDSNNNRIVEVDGNDAAGLGATCMRDRIGGLSGSGRGGSEDRSEGRGKKLSAEA